MRIAIALAASIVAFAPAAAQAPTWSSQQQAVWEVVTRSWTDEVARNGRWPGQYAHASMVNWGPEWPMPRNRASIERWSRWDDTQGRTLQYEISPTAIAMSGDTAVVHYTAVTMRQREVGRGEPAARPEREMVGIVETLVRDGSNWKFLASTGFPLRGPAR